MKKDVASVSGKFRRFALGTPIRELFEYAETQIGNKA
jgi:hypothetical protein